MKKNYHIFQHHFFFFLKFLLGRIKLIFKIQNKENKNKGCRKVPEGLLQILRRCKIIPTFVLNLQAKMKDKTIIVCSGYKGISEEQILNLIGNQPEDNEILWKRRNMVWHAGLPSVDVVVKSFGTAFMGEYVYAFRESKAKRSYKYAIEIRHRGFKSPAPVAYIERRSAGRLLFSAYICEYTSDVALEDAIHIYGKECLKAFAVYAMELHGAGIRHDDLNSTNVRVGRCDDGSFTFSLIDLNRMKIYPPGLEVPMRECFDNLCRFCYDDSAMKYFVECYVEARNLPADYVEIIMNIKKANDLKHHRKKQKLHAIGRIFGLNK